MKHVPAKSLDTALLPPGTPMFSNVIQHLERNPELIPKRNRDAISGLHRVARALGRTPEEVPAHTRWLQPRLAKVAPAALGLTPKSWSNILSNARAGLSAFGVVARRHGRKSELSSDWRELWDIALASEHTSLARALCRFVYFLSHQGVSPLEVTDEHAADYLRALEENEISKSPDNAHRTAVRAWNRAVRLLPEWPRITLDLPSRQKLVKMPDDTFPLSLHQDLDRLVETLEHPDPFDLDGRSKPVRPKTVQIYRAVVLCFAADLVRAGVPADTIVDIAAICTPEMVEKGLRQMVGTSGNRTRLGIAQSAGVLRNLARSYCRVPEGAQKKISDLARRMAPKPQNGMTAKNRDRLRVLQDDAEMRKLLLLPEQLFESANSGRKPHYCALDREIAVAIAILIVCPIRVKNLSEIHLEQNLRREADGRVFLVFEEEEVKNERRLEFEVPPNVARMIDRHLATRVPELCPPGTAWLFPRRHGRDPIDRGNMSTRISRTILRTTGLTMNPHLFRHMASMIFLDKYPGAYEALRRLLGHSSTSHTFNVYSGMENRAATRMFSDLISAKKSGRS